jgi:cytochrome c-type biogenesis protein CcmH/NrfG
MTTDPANPVRRRRRVALVLACLACLLGVAAGGWWLRRERPPQPPTIDPDGVDPEVAALVDLTRKDVLAEPRSAKNWGRLGMVLRAHGFADESSACFAEAERLDPREPRWPYYRGLTLVLTDPEEGLACLRRAVGRMDDDALEPRFRLAEVLIQQGHQDEAARVLDDARALQPGHPRGRLLKARLAQAVGDDRGAVNALEGCWDDAQARRQAHLIAAAAWQGLGDAARAEEYQAKAARLPDDAPWPDPLVEEVERLAVGSRARLSQALALHQQGRKGDAAALLERAVEDRPRDAAAWLMLAQLRWELGGRPQAEAAFARVVALDPDNVEGWYGLGAARLGRSHREAADAFREVTRIKPDHAQAHYLLGVALKGKGDREAARAAWRQALRCQPDHDQARKALAELDAEAEKKP